MVFVGLMILIAGIFTFPLPLPVGLPLIIIALIILLRNSSWARLGYRHLRIRAKNSRFFSNLLTRFDRLVHQQKANLKQRSKVWRKKRQEAKHENQSP